jgi:hypothetical protein
LAKRLLLRDAENFSQDQIQRILGSLLWNLPVVGGVGTGYSAGIVGKAPTTSTGHLAVTANGSTMVLTMLPGWASVLRDAGGTTYDPRTLFAESDANDTATVTNNSTGSTRNDTVCLKVDMNTAPTSDGSNLVSFAIIAGASGGGLSNAPADGNLYLPLANVAVANGATSIAQGNVTDLRRVIPAAPNIPGGTLPSGYAQATANQTTITAQVDLTGLTVTVTVTAGRRIRIRGFCGSVTSSVAGDIGAMYIMEGATQLGIGTSPALVAAFGPTLAAEVILTPSAGSHTYKLQAARVSGTGNLIFNASASNPMFILAEDIAV